VLEVKIRWRRNRAPNRSASSSAGDNTLDPAGETGAVAVL